MPEIKIPTPLKSKELASEAEKTSEKPSYERTHRHAIEAVLAGTLLGLAPQLAQANEKPEGPQLAPELTANKKDPRENRPPDTTETEAIQVKHHATAIIGGQRQWAEDTNGVNTNLEGGLRLGELRFSGQSKPGLIPNGELQFFGAAGIADNDPYAIGEGHINVEGVGLRAGYSNHTSSYLSQFYHLRNDNGARIKPDGSYFELAPLPIGYDRFAEISLDVGPKQKRKLVQLLGGVRSGVGMTGVWKPTGLLGVNFNLDHSVTGIKAHLGQENDFYLEAYHRRVEELARNLRYELIAVGLANNYSMEPNGERQLKFGSSVLNAIGVGKRIGGDSPRFNFYNRTDVAFQSKPEMAQWNTSFGASIAPSKRLSDLILTSEFSVMNKEVLYEVGGTIQNTRQNVARLMFMLQVKI